jgi:outer membrane protein insertion porin family
MVRHLGALLVLVAILFTTAYTADRDLLKWSRKRPFIKAIDIVGNQYFTAGEIRGRLYSRTDGFWKRFKGDRRIRIQRETTLRDSLEVMFLYLTNGFVAARMRSEYEPIGQDSSARVRIIIDEGRQFRYGPHSLSGSYDTKYSQQLNKIASKLKEGNLVNPFQLRQAQFDMKTLLANNGYPYADVSYLLDTLPGPAVANIEFRVEGDSVVQFGTVKLEGLTNFPDYVARRELKMKPGARYRRDDILDSQRRLYESGYFSTLTLNRDEASPNRLRPDFILHITERKTRYVSVQAGAAQSLYKDLLWDLAASYGQRNVFGSRQFSLSSSYSFSVGRNGRLIEHRYQAKFTEPWFLGLRMPLTLSGDWRPRIRSKTQPYDISSWAVGTYTVKKFGQEITTDLGFEYQSVSLYGLSADQPVIEIQEKDYSNRRKLYFDYRRDSRPNPFIPDRGSLTTVSVQYVGGFLGGGDSFKKIEASFASYQIIWPGWISATRVMGGWVREFGSSATVPREDRLFLGGAGSVRGFAENTLGPKRADGSADGANVTAVFNQEFRWKTIQVLQHLPLLKGLFKPFPLWQSVFFDMGNGFRAGSDVSFDALAYSYGTGIQLVTPAGPIRVDYARVIPTERFGVASRWHFTILYAF